MPVHRRPVWHAGLAAQHACPAAPQGPHMPGVPWPRLRPLQANPVLHVPLLPVPQHGWPSAPHVPHWSPAVATMHASAPVHAVTPPSIGGPVTAQQGWPLPPQVVHIPGVPCPELRPAQARPVLHVPLPPVPQHD